MQRGICGALLVRSDYRQRRKRRRAAAGPGNGRPVHAARARLRTPGVPEQDRARPLRGRRRPAAPRADAGLLRLLRLALGRPWPLAAGPPRTAGGRSGARSRRARRPGAQPDARQHRRRAGDTCEAAGASVSSARTAWRGCCNWRPSCASGAPTGRPRAGWRRWSRWSARRPNASRTGCPSSPTRFASASILRPRSRSGSRSTGRARRTTWIWSG